MEWHDKKREKNTKKEKHTIKKNFKAKHLKSIFEEIFVVFG
jgi:hypothetical protein